MLEEPVSSKKKRDAPDALDHRPPVAPLLLDIRELAIHLRWSIRSVRRAEAAGLLPCPVRVGGSVRWRREEILRWVEAGCPPRTGHGPLDEVN
jgi:predicted DNA-binding transcriptional regulator AlpA